MPRHRCSCAQADASAGDQRFRHGKLRDAPLCMLTSSSAPETQIHQLNALSKALNEKTIGSVAGPLTLCRIASRPLTGVTSTLKAAHSRRDSWPWWTGGMTCAAMDDKACPASLRCCASCRGTFSRQLVAKISSPVTRAQKHASHMDLIRAQTSCTSPQAHKSAPYESSRGFVLHRCLHGGKDFAQRSVACDSWMPCSLQIQKMEAS